MLVLRGTLSVRCPGAELAGRPAATERANEALKGTMSSVESRMTRLSSNETGSPAAQEAADAREQRERLERMAWLSRCQAVVADHLGR